MRRTTNKHRLAGVAWMILLLILSIWVVACLRALRGSIVYKDWTCGFKNCEKVVDVDLETSQLNQ